MMRATGTRLVGVCECGGAGRRGRGSNVSAMAQGHPLPNPVLNPRNTAPTNTASWYRASMATVLVSINILGPQLSRAPSHSSISKDTHAHIRTHSHTFAHTRCVSTKCRSSLPLRTRQVGFKFHGAWLLCCLLPMCALRCEVQADIGARAKFVLRKLASSIVPAVSSERHHFVQARLGLTRTPAAENRWTKEDCVRTASRRTPWSWGQCVVGEFVWEGEEGGAVKLFPSARMPPSHSLVWVCRFSGWSVV